MARRSTPLNSFFDGRWFDDEIIILCLRWYFRYKLSYRDLVEMGGRGLPVAHTTILWWAVRYAEEFEKQWRRYERPEILWTFAKPFYRSSRTPMLPRRTI